VETIMNAALARLFQAGRFSLLAILLGVSLAGCGVNNIPTQEEAAKAKGIVDEMRRRLKDEETQCEAEWFAARFRRHWNPLYANRGVRTFLQTSKHDDLLLLT
jgi:cytochrome c biogenesis protein ResB